MKGNSTNRRSFIWKISIGAWVMATGVGSFGSNSMTEVFSTSEKKKQQSSIFNMSGYAAPKIDTVRICMIGVGERGKRAAVRLIE